MHGETLKFENMSLLSGIV